MSELTKKEELIDEQNDFGEMLQTLAGDLEDDDTEPMRVVSMQIHGEQSYKKLEKLMDEYLKEVDGVK